MYAVQTSEIMEMEGETQRVPENGISISNFENPITRYDKNIITYYDVSCN